MRNSERRRQFFRSFEAQALRSRSLLTQLSDDLTSTFGSTPFLLLNFFWFLGWIAINVGWVPGIEPFDPFPFGLLTMVVSLEAIFLSIFVLVSQNRSSYISSLREEVHMRVNLIAEEEVTKVLQILAELRKKMGVEREDPELKEMLERIDTNYIERSIAEQIQRANKPLFEHLTKDFPDILMYPITKPIEVIRDIATGNGQPEPASSKAHTD